MTWTADEMYGGSPATPPVTNAVPAGPTTAIARTTPRTSGLSLQNPTVCLLLILGLAIWLIHFSVGFNFGFEVDHK